MRRLPVLLFLLAAACGSDPLAMNPARDGGVYRIAGELDAAERACANGAGNALTPRAPGLACSHGCGLALGRAGYEREGLCAGSREFDEGYALGSEEYLRQGEAAAARYALSDAQRAFWKAKHRRAEASLALAAPALAADDRRALKAEIAALDAMIASLETDMTSLLAALNEAEAAAASASRAADAAAKAAPLRVRPAAY